MLTRSIAGFRRLMARVTTAAGLAACLTLAAAAAVFVALLSLPATSEEALNRQTFALIARDESAQLADLFGAADDLSLLAPVAERPAVVETFVSPGS